jgi:hypothetical protein
MPTELEQMELKLREVDIALRDLATTKKELLLDAQPQPRKLVSAVEVSVSIEALSLAKRGGRAPARVG